MTQDEIEKAAEEFARGGGREEMSDQATELLLEKILKTIAPMAVCDICGLMWDQESGEPRIVWKDFEPKWICGKCREAERK